LAHAGHPIIGDAVYGGRVKRQLSLRERERNLAGALLACLPRQALHACELAFTHPVTGEERTFTSSLPEDFAHALELLREFVKERGDRTHHA
jgi:23S rRNA pseudouridine1911/1915/1917 synthase